MLKRIIVAIQDKDNGIGNGPNLLYPIREDLQRFKKMTLGQHLLLGRKTLGSFPNGPLGNRTHLVLSRKKQEKIPQVHWVTSLSAALEDDPKIKTLNIIGGGEIYKQTISHADIVELTRIQGEKESTVFFPKIEESGFYRTQLGRWKIDPRSQIKFRYERWEQRKPTLRDHVHMLLRTYK